MMMHPRLARMKKLEAVLRATYKVPAWMKPLGVTEEDVEEIILELAPEWRDHQYTTEEVARIMKVRTERLAKRRAFWNGLDSER